MCVLAFVCIFLVSVSKVIQNSCFDSQISSFCFVSVSKDVEDINGNPDK